MNKASARTRHNQVKAGNRLRLLRNGLGLSLREVEEITRQIASERTEPAYHISATSLSEIECNGVTPTIFRIAALSEAYGLTVTRVLELYDIST